MGTNYYLREKPCECCGRAGEDLHIGKSSAGWCFVLHVYPDLKINSLKDWEERISKGGEIVNEYEQIVTTEELLDNITNRSFGGPLHEFVDKYSEPGPNNMLRHKIGDFCIGHGEGTWDYVIGEFA